MDDFNTNKLERAKERVARLKGFYIHATIYTIINTVILWNIFSNNGYNGEGFWQLGNFTTLFFWGIGLFFHAVKVFNLNPFFNKDWEKRQIQKYMEEDKKEAEKYKKR